MQRTSRTPRNCLEADIIPGALGRSCIRAALAIGSEESSRGNLCAAVEGSSSNAGVIRTQTTAKTARRAAHLANLLTTTPNQSLDAQDDDPVASGVLSASVDRHMVCKCGILALQDFRTERNCEVDDGVASLDSNSDTWSNLPVLFY